MNFYYCLPLFCAIWVSNSFPLPLEEMQCTDETSATAPVRIKRTKPKLDWKKIQLSIPAHNIIPPNIKKPWHCHLMKEDSEPPEVCGMWFMSSYTLRRHWSHLHSKDAWVLSTFSEDYISKCKMRTTERKPARVYDNPWTCKIRKADSENDEICGKSYSKYFTLKQHWRREHPNDPWVVSGFGADGTMDRSCYVTPQRTKSVGLTHLVTNPPDPGKPWYCHLEEWGSDPSGPCNTYFGSYSHLRTHWTYMHSKKVYKLWDPWVENEFGVDERGLLDCNVRSRATDRQTISKYKLQYPPVEGKPFYCDFNVENSDPPTLCGRYYSTFHNLRRHWRSFHLQNPETEGRLNEGRGPRKKLFIYSKTRPCITKNFRRPNPLNPRRRYYCDLTDENLHATTECGKRYNEFYDLRRHWQIRHKNNPIAINRIAVYGNCYRFCVASMVGSYWTRHLQRGNARVPVLINLPPINRDIHWIRVLQVYNMYKEELVKEGSRPYYVSLIVGYVTPEIDDVGVEEMIRLNLNNPEFELFMYADSSVHPFPCGYHWKHKGMRDASNVFTMQRNGGYSMFYKLLKFADGETYENIQNGLDTQHYYTLIAAHKRHIAADPNRMQFKMMNKMSVVSKLSLVPVLDDIDFSDAYRMAITNTPLIPLTFQLPGMQTDNIWHIYQPELDLQDDNNAEQQQQPE